MRLIAHIITSILLATSSYSQVLDVAPDGKPNKRAVVGGSEPVDVDTIAPLNELIKRLEGAAPASNRQGLLDRIHG